MATTRDLDRSVRLEIYRFFVGEGRPPLPVELAEALLVASEDVEASLHRLAESHQLVLAPGTPYIWMANPLSALPSPYRVRARDRDWWGICIWDAFGIMAMLGGDGSVSSRCPDCGEHLHVDVSGEKLASSDYVAHYAVPARHWWDDIGFS
jgi:hypothetical protein